MVEIKVGNKITKFDSNEWELLLNHIIKNTLNFWDNVQKDVDGGLLPPELTGDFEMIDRETLHQVKAKINNL